MVYISKCYGSTVFLNLLNKINKIIFISFIRHFDAMGNLTKANKDQPFVETEFLDKVNELLLSLFRLNRIILVLYLKICHIMMYIH